MILLKNILAAIFLMLSAAPAIPLTQVALKEGMRIAVYPGSFDPLHKAHMAIIEAALDLDNIDYVVAYAEQEFTISKPNRTHYPLRQQMLEGVYKDHPRVLLSDDRLVDIIKTLRDHKVTVIALVGADNASPERAMFVADEWVVNVRPGFRDDKNIKEMTHIMGQPVTKIMAKDGTVSSSEIRKNLKKAPQHLPVAGPVRQIIKDEGLYKK